jgi:hypothetical protein
MIFSPEEIFSPGKEFRWGGSFSGRKLSDGIFPQGEFFQFPGEVVPPWGDSSPREIVSYFLREAVFPGQRGCPGDVVPWDGGFCPGEEMLASARSCVPRGWNVPWGEVISLRGEILDNEGAEEDDEGQSREQAVVVGWRGPVSETCGDG